MKDKVLLYLHALNENGILSMVARTLNILIVYRIFINVFKNKLANKKICNMYIMPKKNDVFTNHILKVSMYYFSKITARFTDYK